VSARVNFSEKEYFPEIVVTQKGVPKFQQLSFLLNSLSQANFEIEKAKNKLIYLKANSFRYF